MHSLRAIVLPLWRKLMNNRVLNAISIALLICTAAVAALADAQGFPGGRGQGRGGNRNSTDSGDAANAARRSAATGQSVTEPALALERELPSLRSDLLLDATQLDAWNAFERSVRDAAQAARGRQRRAVDLRQAAMVGGLDLPPDAASNSLQMWVDDERNRADLLVAIVNSLGPLTRTLDPRQAGMLNRRVVQALRDPLGAS
jgi:hypothetical protein